MQDLHRPPSWNIISTCVLQQDIFVRYTYTAGRHTARVFIIVVTQVHYKTPPWSGWIQPTSSHRISLRFILILSSHLYLCLPSDMCSSGSDIITSIPTCCTPLAFLLLSRYTKKLFLFIVLPFSVHLIWIFTADIDRYTRRPHPCGIVLWQGFLYSPSTWVKHFTLPCITLYPLLHGQTHISFCQITSCHACRHSALPGVNAFKKFQGKEQIRAADKITIRIVAYSISIRWTHIHFQWCRKTTANSDC